MADSDDGVDREVGGRTDKGKHLKAEERLLPCPLNEAELIQRGGELAEAVQGLAIAEEYEAERRENEREYLQARERVVARLAETVSSKVESREVMVVSDLVSTASGMMVSETREDTGEVLGMRQPTAQELQGGLGV